MNAKHTSLGPQLSLTNRMVMRHLGDTIKAARELQGLEYEELSGRPLIDPYLIHKIESGDYELNMGELEEIANSLRCTLSITLTPCADEEEAA